MDKNFSIDTSKFKTNIEGQIEYSLTIRLGKLTRSKTFFSTDSPESILNQLQSTIDEFKHAIQQQCPNNTTI